MSYKAKVALERIDNSQATGKIPELSEAERDMTPGKLARSDPGPRTQALRRATQPLLELFIGRAIDQFQTYVVSIIREVLRKRPEILSSSTYSLDVKSIFEHSTIDSLVRDLVERKVDDLSYRGFEELAGWCRKQGIPLVVPSGSLDQVIELIATRNAIAHNGGVIDHKYLATVKNPRFKIGEIRVLEVDDLLGTTSLLGEVVGATDSLAVSSFGLETIDL